MLYRHLCLRWLLGGTLLFLLFTVGDSNTTESSDATEEDDSVDKLDSTIIYIIVGVCVVFVLSVAVVIAVSCFQTNAKSDQESNTREIERTNDTQRPGYVIGSDQSGPQQIGWTNGGQRQSDASSRYQVGSQMTTAAMIHSHSSGLYPDRQPAVANTNAQRNSDIFRQSTPSDGVESANVQRFSGVSWQSRASDRGPEVYVLSDPNRTSQLSQVDAAYELNPITPNEQPTWWEIPQNKLKIYRDNVLGSGQFGVILLGEVIKGRQEISCAVKTLKREATSNEKESLKTELKNMSTMDPHPYIVNLIGAQTRDGEFNVVVEYCANGDLYNYVKKNRLDLSSLGLKGSGTTIEYVTRLRISFDTANGMAYLSTRGFIHRDLAARNVLLDGELRAKVSDFGRSRDVSATFKTIQSIRKNEPIPTRWMPVETLRKQEFTSKSDVWSFGVLLWEIESGAVRPYNDLQTYRQVVNRVVHEGYRLEQPYYCPDVIYEIMKECWKIDPDERPTFTQIATNLGNLLQANMSNQIHYTTMPTLPREERG